MRRTSWGAAACLGAAAALVTAAPTPASATFEGHEGLIAFRRYFDPERTSGAVFTVRPNGNHEQQITHPPAAFVDDDPDWSPDGSKLAFIRVAANGCGPDCLYAWLFVVNSDGTGLTQLTSTRLGVDCANGGGCATEPAWSPDGRRLVFSRQTGPLLAYDEWAETAVYTVRPDGTDLTQVTQKGSSTGVDEAPQFSPDGRTIAFERRNIRAGLPADGQAIWTVDVDGSHEQQVTPYDLRGGDTTDWSPDGRRILFESNENGSPDVSANVYTIRPDGTGLRQLTFATGGGDAQHFASSYSPDGKSVTFARTPGAGPEGNADVLTMRPDGSHVRPVTTSPLWDSRPDWGPRR